MIRKPMTASAIAVLCLLIITVAFASCFDLPLMQGTETPPMPPAHPTGKPFIYSFNTDGILNESEEQDTTSPYWWLNSGGALIIKEHLGKTLQGDLSALEKWRLNYSVHNPIDSDNGYHPQNIFRLISRRSWENPRVSVSLRILKDNLSDSDNRNETNGVFIMSRYVDAQTLYYAGIRADGHAVIKKKYLGTYHTLAERALFLGTYDRARSANLIPHSEWLELTSETMSVGDATVIRLFMKRYEDAQPVLLLQVTDDGALIRGQAPITEKTHIGIRTDFMDVEFEKITVVEMGSR